MTQDRRIRLRFPLKTDLRFQIIRRGQGKPIQGVGQATDMSSKGLAFHTETPLDRGQRLSVSMAWPAMLDEKCMLRLAMEGTIVRTEGTLIVLSIESHDFRTSGKLNSAAREEVAGLVRTFETLLPARLQ